MSGGAKTSARPGLTAAQVGAALVVAAKMQGLCPSRVFDGAVIKDGFGKTLPGPYHARVVAGAGLRARVGVSAAVCARAVRVAATELAPSMLARRGVTTEMLLDVAEAVNAVSPGAPPAPVPPRPRGGAGGGAGGGSRAGAVRKRPADVVPTAAQAVPAPAVVTPAVVAPAVVAPAVVVSGVRTRPSPPRVVGGRDVGRPVSRPVGRVQRLKPVTAKIARWAAQQLARGADVDFVAECFGVDADDLMQVIRDGHHPGGAVAGRVAA